MAKSKQPDENHQAGSIQSKSELKRSMQARQKIGEKLVQLQPQQLAQLSLDETLIDAITTAQKIKHKHEAYRRQLQFIGKLMRYVDAEHIDLKIADLKQESNTAKLHLHALEQLRHELIEQGDARLKRLLEAHPELNSQSLRQWIRQAQKEARHHQTPKASRTLFRYLRDTITLL